jgi:hypothetical protein
MEKYMSVRPAFMIASVLTALMLAGCSGTIPVPGGDEQVNSKTYRDHQDLINRVNGLQIGMSENLVLSMLNRQESDLTRLSRPEIMTALYGGSNAGFDGTYEQQEKARAFLQTLTGFKLQYINTEKEHGFSSPIRIKTHESGYNYTLTLIFQNGHLFDQPILSGGEVDGYTSKTVFDYLNPGNIIGMH